VNGRSRDLPVVIEPEAMFEFTRPAWQAKANCHPDVIPDVWQPFGPTPVDLFFPPDTRGRITATRRAAIAQVCGGCTVRLECREHALKHEDGGWWANEQVTDFRHERRVRGIRLDTPEVAPDGRVLGTFFYPPHGTMARYAMHVRAGEKPCEVCQDGSREQRRPLARRRYENTVLSMTPREYAERLARERDRADRQRIKERRGQA